MANRSRTRTRGALWRNHQARSRRSLGVACFQRLAAQNPAAKESHLALAEATLAAELWGEKRAAIPPLPTPRHRLSPPRRKIPGQFPQPVVVMEDRGDILSRATQRLCLMMERGQEADDGDLLHAREWLGPRRPSVLTRVMFPTACWRREHESGVGASGVSAAPSTLLAWLEPRLGMPRLRRCRWSFGKQAPSSSSPPHRPRHWCYSLSAPGAGRAYAAKRLGPRLTRHSSRTSPW